ARQRLGTAGCVSVSVCPPQVSRTSIAPAPTVTTISISDPCGAIRSAASATRATNASSTDSGRPHSQTRTASPASPRKGASAGTVRTNGGGGTTGRIRSGRSERRPFEQRRGGATVVGDPGLELVQAAEPLFGPDPPDELEPHSAPVQVVMAVEQVRLDRVPPVANRRPHAHARHRPVPLGPDPRH